MSHRNLIMTILGLFTLTTAISQKKTVHVDLFTLAKENKMIVYNNEVTPLTDHGRTGIRFSEKENDGLAWIPDLNFTNGIIEVDIKGRDVPQKSFLGVAFHWTDQDNMDIVYFRPFNFRSPDAVRRIHAVQYVSSPGFTWQRLRTEQNGKYEKAIEPAPLADDWFHAKIVVRFPHVEVYVNGNQTASLLCDKLNTRTTGKIGLWVGPNSDGDFANLVVTGE